MLRTTCYLCGGGWRATRVFCDVLLTGWLRHTDSHRHSVSVSSGSRTRAPTIKGFLQNLRNHLFVPYYRMSLCKLGAPRRWSLKVVQYISNMSQTGSHHKIIWLDLITPDHRLPTLLILPCLCRNSFWIFSIFKILSFFLFIQQRFTFKQYEIVLKFSMKMLITISK